MFGSQVSLCVHYRKRDEVYLATLLSQNNGRQMALYRDCCFPSCAPNYKKYHIDIYFKKKTVVAHAAKCWTQCHIFTCIQFIHT